MYQYYIPHVGYCGADPDFHQDYLAHYGVMGMHWGVRKARSYRDTMIDYATRQKKLKLKGQKVAGDISGKEYRAGKRGLSAERKQLLRQSKQVGKAQLKYARGERKNSKGISYKTLYKNDRADAHRLVGLDPNRKTSLDRAALANRHKVLNSVGASLAAGIIPGNIARTRIYNSGYLDSISRDRAFQQVLNEEERRRRASGRRR